MIGQLLESVGVEIFELEKHGQYYELWSDALTNGAEWDLRKVLGNEFSMHHTARYSSKCSVSFSLSNISHLDAKAQKKRKNDLSSNTQAYTRLSQLLRTLGEHLDRNDVSAFHISWSLNAVSIVIFPMGPLVIESTTLTAERLRQMNLHMKLRRNDRLRMARQATGRRN